MSIAAFTITQDDSLHLKKWLRHHRPCFDALYVLDHDSRGDDLEQLHALTAEFEAQVLPVSYELSYSSVFLAKLARRFQAFLLASHTLTHFSPVDELLVSRDPLSDYLRAFQQDPRPFVYAPLWRVWHDPSQEDPLRPDEPWLPQRENWALSEERARPVLAKQELYWAPGWFRATNAPCEKRYMEAQLALVAVRGIDYQKCLQRRRQKVVKRWDPEDRLGGPFAQRRSDDPDLFAQWWARQLESTEAIPQPLKDRF